MRNHYSSLAGSFSWFRSGTKKPSSDGFFTSVAAKMSHQSSDRRTAIYIDGYNLYYGLLRGTDYKWLDVVALFSQIVHTIDPASRVVFVKYFTAPALAKFASHGNDSVSAQNEYLRALESKYPNVFQKVMGAHVYDKKGTYLPRYLEGKPFDRRNKVKVWRLVEKKTDVNLAMGMYRDANKRLVDQLVLVSNDTDAEPVLKALKDDFPCVRIGLIVPLSRPNCDGAENRPPKNGRPANATLSKYAHWKRLYIRDDELEKALLPDQVATPKKPAQKPPHW